MRLVHFGVNGELIPRTVQQTSGRGDKPDGLWVSDEDAQASWSAWCREENFRLAHLKHAHVVTLATDARILMLTTAEQVEALGSEYGRTGVPYPFGSRADRTIDWPRIAESYQGVLITPYQWSRRMNGPDWYYSWDCASGCIWDAAAIESVTAIEPCTGEWTWQPALTNFRGDR